MIQLKRTVKRECRRQKDTQDRSYWWVVVVIVVVEVERADISLPTEFPRYSYIGLRVNRIKHRGICRMLINSRIISYGIISPSQPLPPKRGSLVKGVKINTGTIPASTVRIPKTDKQIPEAIIEADLYAVTIKHLLVSHPRSRRCAQGQSIIYPIPIHLAIRITLFPLPQCTVTLTKKCCQNGSVQSCTH